MNDFWIPRTAPSLDSSESEIRSMGWAEAQEWCNFVLLHPSALPEDCAIAEAVVRPEAPPGRRQDQATGGRPSWTLSNRSSHRLQIHGQCRTLRVKQFLYDWAPPAFDHPSLWRSDNRPFRLGEQLGWLGEDFQGQQAASVHIDRTMVEVRVDEGAFSDEELAGICRGLKPARPDLRSRILATPLADLCYQGRHVELVIPVPVGYWKHRREPPTLMTRVFRGRETPQGVPAQAKLPEQLEGFRLDTVFVFLNPDLPEPQEADYAYALEEDRGIYLRILASPRGVAEGINYPPVLDEQPCSTEVMEIAGRRVYRAFLDSTLGPHEAVWQDRDHNFMLLAKPTRWSDAPWFESLVDKLIRGEQECP